MKKTLIAMLALAGMAMAAPQALTLVSPSGSTLESGNKGIAWSSSTVDDLQSWTLTFELLDEAFKTKAPNTTSSGDYSDSVSVLFGTKTDGNGAAGFLVGVTNNGALTLFTHKQNTTFTAVATADNWIKASATERNTVSISFIADVNKEDEVVGGSFILTANGNSQTFDIETLTAINNSQSFDFESHLSYTSLTNAPGNGGSRLWTNTKAEKFYNISLTQLDSNLVPEPTTATLSLLALAGLAARRRRASR